MENVSKVKTGADKNAPVVTSSEVKVEKTVEAPKVEKPKKKHTGFKIFSCLTFMLLLTVAALVAGGYGYVKFEPWLIDHGFIKGDGTVEIGSNDGNGGEKVIKVTSEENVVISVVKESMDSVVTIAVSQVDFNSEGGLANRTDNIGTGFVVDSQGYILTNQHVVSNPNVDYEVILNDGTSFPVESIARDDINDIALLKVDAENLETITLGDSDALVAGQMVIAIGTPLGEFAGSVTTGVISGLNRSVSTGTNSFFGSSGKLFEDVIQTDAAVNPGNSGGPLLNSAGEVIGVNFATTSGADNISFALPINRAKARLEEYRKFGKFIKPFVGLQYQMISEADARAFDNLVAGALVVRVTEDGPASKAGIERGDIITKINGASIKSSFATAIQEFQVGDKLKLSVWRDGEDLELEIVLAEAE